MSLSASETARLGVYPGSRLLDSIFVQLCIQLLVGAILSVSYVADPIKAHAAVAGMHEGALRLLQGLHYWGSALLIVETLLLLILSVWRGWFRAPFRWEYFLGVASFALAFGFQLSGNVLPMDKHGVETTSVEAGIAARAPVVGSELRHLMLQGNGFSAQTLGFWYALHAVLGGLFLVAAAIRIWRFRSQDHASSDGKWVAGITIVPFILAVLLKSPFGSQATPADYGSFDARVSWYTWPLHGALVMFDHLRVGLGWLGAMVVPGLLVLVLLSLPFLGPRVSSVMGRASLVAGALLFGSAAVFFGGAFAPLMGTRDPRVAVASTSAAQLPQNAALAAQGRQLFSGQGCNSCHGTDGVGGGAGPTLAAEGLKHPDAAFYEKYIHSPISVDPQSTMPAFGQLTQAQLASIAEFLRYKKG